MHDYLLSSEWVRFAFVFGVAVSMLLYERRHLTTGSIVVPGYIAVFMIHPLVIIATFANAFITYWLVNHILRRFFLLYGRTKFTILAATSTIIQTILLRATPRGQWLWESNIPLFIGVGYVVPALIAHDMARQGVWKTTKSVMLAGFIVATPIFVALALDLPGVNDLAPLDGFGSMAIEGRWLPLAVLLSVLASWAVAMNYGLRSGGFIGAAFLSMFMGDPWQVAAAIATAALTYLIVTRLLMNSMILFGRRKFSSMLLVSSVISWTALWVGARFFSADLQSHFELGSLALTPLLLPGLLANDAQRTAPDRVFKGVVLGGAFVLTTTWWVQSVVTGAILHPGWKLISVATAGAVFAPQLRNGWAWLVARFGNVQVEHQAEPAQPEPVAVEPVEQQPEPAAVEAAAPEPAEIGPPVQPEPVEIEAPVQPEPVAARTEPVVDVPAPRVPQTVRVAWEPVPRARPSAPPSAPIMPWQEWAEHHPDAAVDAVAWLDAELARQVATPAPALVGTGARAIDDLTFDVLEQALEGTRGVPRVPRGRRRNPLASGLRAGPLIGEIPAASGGVREARAASPDVVEQPGSSGERLDR